jgi:uncharacterized membrane protein
MAGFTGLLFIGWGTFNLVEGLIDHHLLEIHHVRDMPAHVPAYDWLFLGFGGLTLIAVGWLLVRLDPSAVDLANLTPRAVRLTLAPSQLSLSGSGT